MTWLRGDIEDRSCCMILTAYRKKKNKPHDHLSIQEENGNGSMTMRALRTKKRIPAP